MKDRVSPVGYANGFEQTIEYLHAILPSSEPIGDALRPSGPHTLPRRCVSSWRTCSCTRT